VHANLSWRFGWLENVIATPAFHHWHHTNDGPDVIDKNFASMLPWIDRLFGTFHVPKRQFPRSYGIAAPMPKHFWGQLAFPWSSQALPQTRPQD
jgi:sterol desaturase/sphingolipid hydroxylase (fatty acid hydroxylase superfamily)